MRDWSSIFDEAYPVAGACPADLDRLAAEVGRPLPPSYRSFLSWSNGGEFRTGSRWLEVFPAIGPIHGVLAISEAYEVQRHMPAALPVAFNGGGTFHPFDLRRPAVGGEYSLVCAHSGNLG